MELILVVIDIVISWFRWLALDEPSSYSVEITQLICLGLGGRAITLVNYLFQLMGP
jgi:hypothetical protein